MGSNPIEALIFFQASTFQLLKLENLLRWSHLLLFILFLREVWRTCKINVKIKNRKNFMSRNIQKYDSDIYFRPWFVMRHRNTERWVKRHCYLHPYPFWRPLEGYRTFTHLVTIYLPFLKWSHVEICKQMYQKGLKRLSTSRWFIRPISYFLLSKLIK